MAGVWLEIRAAQLEDPEEMEVGVTQKEALEEPKVGGAQ
jgi:hypothetical protein